VDYDENARLDTSQVSDTRGSGGIGAKHVAIGGGGLGIVGVIIVVVLQLVGGGSSSSTALSQVLGQLGQSGAPATADNSTVEAECQSGVDAKNKLDCAVVADINSIQAYWTVELPKLGAAYSPVNTVWFSGQTSTGCGDASAASGPFYCPADKLVYIDLTFYNDLQTTFGATGGLFVDAYVLAHEYGHHVQDLLGIEAKVQAGDTGPSSSSVRLELQADCFAGVWAHNASTVPGPDGSPLVKNITDPDIANALDTAAKIGDDYIQTQIEHQTFNAASETHGTSAQRQKWFSAGYRSGDPNQCDTFAATTL
jgi:uncharacterized protein